MKTFIYIVLFCLSGTGLYAQTDTITVDTRVDNLLYWKRMIALGLVKASPKVTVPKAVYTGSQINSPFVELTDSQDVLTDDTPDYTHSENTVSIDPANTLKALNSNISMPPNGLIFRIGEFTTTNQGANWSGSVSPFNNVDQGDPTAAISDDGRYYVSFITDPTAGQGVAVSTDEGATWQTFTIADPGGSGLLDKGHLWVNKSSLYLNDVYSAWTNISTPTDANRIAFSRSTNGGVTWSTSLPISQATAGGSHEQGVNINNGPNGDVYAVWAIYESWPSDESAIGFAKSTDGGANFDDAVRIVDNIRGIRMTLVGKGIRVNSYPSMTVDNSFGPNRGTIYVVWSNVGTPGTNSGEDVDIYLIKSTDGGASWTSPQQVNSSTPDGKKKHFFPWITCDQTTGKLHIVYYDDRNVDKTDCETWMSSSFDGGNTWDDYKISDVSFTPVYIPPHATYFGDYLGVTANDDIIYPVWTDNRSGRALSYTSPLISSDFCPDNLTIQNITMPVNAVYKYRAVNSISVAGSSTSFVMQGNGTTGARASMVAGNSITLSPNTTIERGAVLTIVPGPCSSAVLRPIVGSSDEFRRLNIHPKEFEINSQINIYPNPIANVIYIEFSKEVQNKSNLSYKIYDLRRSVILQGLIAKNLSAVNTGKLAAGGYFISFFEDKKLMETKKIIKR